MSCITTSPIRSLNYLHGKVSGDTARTVGNAPASPSAKSGGFARVYDMFRAWVALVFCFGLSCGACQSHVSVVGKFEFTARIVLAATPKWLGYMAIGSKPISVRLPPISAGEW